MNTKTIYDERINRNNNFGGYCRLSRELVKQATGYDKKFAGGEMSWNEYKSTAYKETHFEDVQVHIVLDFNTHKATITYDDPISKPDWVKL